MDPSSETAELKRMLDQLIRFPAHSPAHSAPSSSHSGPDAPHYRHAPLPFSQGSDGYEPAFGEHVNSLRGTMFYVCQGSCLCGTVNNRGKVIYCYGDLVPRHGELFAEGTETGGKTSSKDLLAALLGVWTFGIVAL